MNSQSEVPSPDPAWTERLKRSSGIRKLVAHVPPAMFGRYLAVGSFNTVFGYSSYAVLTAIFSHIMMHGYVLAGVISCLLNVTVAFLGYKWFVFRTKGHYLREWLRCVGVYSTGILFGIVLLPILVFGLRSSMGLSRSAPYVAGALLSVANVVLSFVGHKRLSFRPATYE